MSLDSCTNIVIKDCSLIQLPLKDIEALKSFNTNAVAFNCFNFKPNFNNTDDSSLLEYDYKNNNWWSGRFIGEANFTHNGSNYKLSIQPRFGELFLFRMFEEIYNVKLTHSANKISKTNDIQYLIRKVISFIWVQLLANANKHGIPKNSISRIYQGTKIKGKIDVNKTIQTLTKANLITSSYKEKSIDSTIASIILKAYKILKSDYGLDSVNLPDNAQDALNDLFNESKSLKNISQHEYKTIVYKDIYITFKPLVDFSWDIIQKKNILNQDKSNTTNNGFSFFIDIAEIWELYLKSLLKKKLQPIGWKQINANHIVYRDRFYERSIIPDIVFIKDDKSVVWDAKYKRMYFFNNELDRFDFFQIHTYASYYSQNSRLISTGLFYPITLKSESDNLLLNYSKGLFGNSNSNTEFVIDGIDISFLTDSSLGIDEKNAIMKIKESEFLKRISLILNDL